MEYDYAYPAISVVCIDIVIQKSETILIIKLPRLTGVTFLIRLSASVHG